MKIILYILLLCAAVQPLLTQHRCEKDFFKTTLFSGDTERTVVLIWFPANAGTYSMLRLCSSKTGLPLRRHCNYDRSTNSSKWEKIDEKMKLLNCSSIPRECLEEPFQHNYIMKNGATVLFNNKWKTTEMNERGDLQEPCLERSGLPLTRLCEYNPLMRRAQWELLRPDMANIYCLRETRESVVTYDLNTLYKDVQTDRREDKVESKKVVRQMTDLLTTSETTRVPADIKISSEILKIVTEDNTNAELVTGVLNFTDVIMSTNRRTVIKSEEVNATTNLLKTIDTYLHRMAKVLVPTNQCQDTTNGIFYERSKSTSVFYINPTCSNVSGVAIYNRNLRRGYHQHHHHSYDEHTGHYYRFLYLNQTLDEILKEPELRLATYFPLPLWNKLKTETGSVDEHTVLTFIIFQNDMLFVNRSRMKNRPHRNILEISVPNYSGELPDDVPFIFSYGRGHDVSYHPPECGYWDYSTWTTYGIKSERRNMSNHNLLICHSSHLTHFAAIFGLSFTYDFSLGDLVLLNISNDVMLEYISIAGCALSLIGITCIWLTAMCFRSFRMESSNKVLLNMSIVLALLMSYFLVLNLPESWKSFVDMKNIIQCTILGAFLHYIVMVLFFWMLIIAVMQYQRYIRVLGFERPSNYIAKYAIVAWGLPIIPVSLVAYIEPGTYMPQDEASVHSDKMCYPSGKSLQYGVILPMALIMLANLFIFIWIFFCLRRSLDQYNRESERKKLVTQVRISVLLFFLLGISWLFGLLSHLESSPMFSYLFCLTSTLQGFVLFLYAVIIDDSTRSSWMKLICGKKYNAMKDRNKINYTNQKLRQKNSY